MEAGDNDPIIGGIKFYMGQYTEELAKKYFPKDPEVYNRMLTLVMTAANIKGDEIKDTGYPYF